MNEPEKEFKSFNITIPVTSEAILKDLTVRCLVQTSFEDKLGPDIDYMMPTWKILIAKCKELDL